MSAERESAADPGRSVRSNRLRWAHPFADVFDDAPDHRNTVLHAGLGSQREDLKQCAAANRVLESLGDPRILQARAVTRLDDGRLSLTTDAAPGLQPVGSFIGRPARLSWIVHVLLETCGALDAAHGLGVFHGALGGGNVLVGDEPERPTVKVTDFGLAHMFSADRAGGGPAQWQPLAPEHMMGHHAGPSTDVYLVGALAFALLAGRPVFRGDTVSVVVRRHAIEEPPMLHRMQLPVRVPRALSRIVLRCLVKEVEDRFEGPADLADALRGHMARKWEEDGPSEASGPIGRSAAVGTSLSAARPMQRRAPAIERAPTPSAAPKPVASTSKPAPVAASKPAPVASKPTSAEPVAASKPATTKPITPVPAPPRIEPLRAKPAATKPKTLPTLPKPEAGAAKAPHRAAPDRVAEAKAGPAKIEKAKAEPAKVEPAKVETAKAEPAKAEPTKPEPAKRIPAPPSSPSDTAELSLASVEVIDDAEEASTAEVDAEVARAAKAELAAKHAPDARAEPPEPLAVSSSQASTTATSRRWIVPAAAGAAAVAIAIALLAGRDDDADEPTKAATITAARPDPPTKHAPPPAPTPPAEPASENIEEPPESVEPEPPPEIEPAAPSEPPIDDALDEPPPDSEPTPDIAADPSTPEGPSSAQQARAATREASEARRKGDIDKAIRLYRRALSLRPGYAPAASGLAFLHFNRGEYDKAAQYGRMAVRSAPNADNLLRLGDTYFKMNRKSDARAQWERAARMGNAVAKKRLAKL